MLGGLDSPRGGIGCGLGSAAAAPPSEEDFALALKGCAWLPEDTREELLDWLDARSDERLVHEALEGELKYGDPLIPAGESLLVLPGKEQLLRPCVGLGGASSGLALEMDADSNCISRLYSCLPPLPRSTLFVGDAILAVDDDEVHSASDLLEV